MPKCMANVLPSTTALFSILLLVVVVVVGTTHHGPAVSLLDDHLQSLAFVGVKCHDCSHQSKSQILRDV
jgi:hypothetical protein